MMTLRDAVRVVEHSTCAGCRLLRAQIVEALRDVDTTDWDSEKGSTQRSTSSVLADIASRLEALGRNEG